MNRRVGDALFASFMFGGILAAGLVAIVSHPNPVQKDVAEFCVKCPDFTKTMRIDNLEIADLYGYQCLWINKKVNGRSTEVDAVVCGPVTVTIGVCR